MVNTTNIQIAKIVSRKSLENCYIAPLPYVGGLKMSKVFSYEKNCN